MFFAVWISWNISTTGSHTHTCTRSHTHKVWKQWSSMGRPAKIWLMEGKVPDTSAVGEPKTADITAASRLIVGCAIGHAFSQLNDVLEWSSGRSTAGAYPHKPQRNLFPPSYCCCGTQSTVCCLWRWLARAAYHHKNDLGHKWRQIQINQKLINNNLPYYLKRLYTALYINVHCDRRSNYRQDLKTWIS